MTSRDRNPFQTFLLAICIPASLPLMQGNAGSAVLEESLPDSTVIGWGVCVLFGSVLALMGMYTPRLWLGWLLERSGLMLAGSAAAIYAGVVAVTAEDVTGVLYALAVHTAFALACGVRAAQITRELRAGRAVMQGGNSG